MLVTWLPVFSATVICRDGTLTGLENCKREKLLHTRSMAKANNIQYSLLTSLQSHQIGFSGAGI